MPWLAVTYYCNSLLYNTKKAYTSRLQRVQNALCGTVCKLNTVVSHPSCTNYTACPFITVFCSNIISSLYKAIHFSQPPYLSTLITRSDLTRGNRLSICSSKPIKKLRATQFHSRGSHRVEQASSSHKKHRKHSWFQKTVENISF